MWYLQRKCSWFWLRMGAGWTAGAERAAATVAGKWRRTAPTLRVVFLKGLDVGEQFFLRCPAAEVEAHHLVGASGRLAACPQADQQAGDDAQVQLDGDPVGAGREQMATTQNAFEPAEEQFRLPTIMPPKRDAYIGPLRAATLPPAEGQGCSSVNYCREVWAWSTAPKRVHPTNLVGTFVSGSFDPTLRCRPRSPSALRG